MKCNCCDNRFFIDFMPNGTDLSKKEVDLCMVMPGTIEVRVTVDASTLKQILLTQIEALEETFGV